MACYSVHPYLEEVFNHMKLESYLFQGIVEWQNVVCFGQRETCILWFWVCGKLVLSLILLKYILLENFLCSINHQSHWAWFLSSFCSISFFVFNPLPFSPCSIVLFDTFVNILSHNLGEPAYEADVAQLEYKLVAGEHGLVIQVKGFNHKLPVSTADLLNTFEHAASQGLCCFSWQLEPGWMFRWGI